MKTTVEDVPVNLAPLLVYLERIVTLDFLIARSEGEERARAEREFEGLLTAPPVAEIPGSGLWRLRFERVATPVQMIADAAETRQ